MTWRLIGRTLRLAFLLRVPLFTLALLAAIGPVSLKSNLLGNLLDQGTREWYLFTVSFSAFLLAFTAITTLNLTLYYGDDRFDDCAPLNLSPKRPLLTFFLGCLAAAILDVCVYFRTIPRSGANIWYLLAGLVAAFALVVVSKIVQLALTDPRSTGHPPPFLIFPVYLLPPVERFFDNIYCWSSGRSREVKSVFNRLCQWPLEILRPAGEGYLINLDPPPGELLRLRSGHVFALTLSILAFLAYLGIGLVKSKNHRQTRDGSSSGVCSPVPDCCVLGAWGARLFLRPLPVPAVLDVDRPFGNHVFRATVGPLLPRTEKAVRLSGTDWRGRLLEEEAGFGTQAANTGCNSRRRHSGSCVDGPGSNGTEQANAGLSGFGGAWSARCPVDRWVRSFTRRASPTESARMKSPRKRSSRRSMRWRGVGRCRISGARFCPGSV